MVDENDVFDLVPDLIEDSVNDDNITEETPQTEEPQNNDSLQEGNKDEEQVDETEADELAQSFYAMLQERNIVPEGEVKSWDDIDAAIDQYKDDLPNQVREQLISSAPDPAKSFIEYAINKPDLTQEDLNEYFKAYKEDQSNQSIETSDDARNLLKPSLIEQWGEETAELMLDSLEDSGKLIDKAKELNTSKTEQLNQEAIQRRQEMEEQQKAFVSSIYQSFDEQPWQDSHKQNVKDFYTNGKADEVINEITQNPKALVELVNILSYYDSKAGTFNLDTFFNKAATKTTNTIRENIKRGLQNRGTSTKSNKAPKGVDLSNFELL